jgi:hypothetical protein
MPYVTKWVEPDVFLEHDKGNIYYTYGENEYDSPLSYHFSVWDYDQEEHDFDVRELKTWRSTGEMFESEEHIEQCLTAAIDNGELDAMYAEYAAEQGEGWVPVYQLA